MPPTRRSDDGDPAQGRRDRSAAGRALPPRSLIALAGAYPGEPVAFRHDLGDDPIFSMPRLMSLAVTLPHRAFIGPEGAPLDNAAASIQALMMTRTGGPIVIAGLDREPEIERLATAQMRPLTPIAAASHAEPEDLTVALHLLAPGQGLSGLDGARHRLLLAGRGEARLTGALEGTVHAGGGIYLPPQATLDAMAEDGDAMWWLCLQWHSPWARERADEAAFLSWAARHRLGAVMRGMIRARSIRARIGRLVGKSD